MDTFRLVQNLPVSLVFLPAKIVLDYQLTAHPVEIKAVICSNTTTTWLASVLQLAQMDTILW